MELPKASTKFVKCGEHGKDKVYIDTINKKTLCPDCGEDTQRLRRVDEYCLEALVHWRELRGWARYLEVEAMQKEKEYGIPWRSAFKLELKDSVEQLRQRQMADKLHNQLMMENKFEVLKAIVGNHLAEVESNQAENNADMVLFLQENYRFLERHVKYLKALLKEEDVKRFPEIKQRVLVL